MSSQARAIRRRPDSALRRTAAAVSIGGSRRTRVILIRALPAAIAALLLAVGLGACGVSASSDPKKVGNAYQPNSVPNEARSPVSPTDERADQFVRDYLEAAAGGADTVAKFLSPAAQKQWQRPKDPAIQIIRVLDLSVHTADPDLSTKVDVTFIVVGIMSVDDGRVVPPSTYSGAQTKQLTLVHPDDGTFQWRINAGWNLGLTGYVLSDEALVGSSRSAPYYLAQPIYFWDKANRVLVPDLRYVPLTISPQLRASRIIGWLISGPSLLLTDAVNKLPPNSALATVDLRDQTLVIKLSPQTGGKGTPEDLNRLVYQLQASLVLATERQLEIWVGNNPVQPNDPTDYHTYELAAQLPEPIQKYDLDNGVVKSPANLAGDAAPPLPMITVRENSQVLYAAINRADDLAAFVRGNPANPSLVIVSADKKVVTVRGLPRSAAYGRPAWIPDAAALLVAWGGRLYLVDQAGTAGVVQTNGLGDITDVTVAPDGRRVALVADGQVTISAITVTAGGDPLSVQLAGQPQPIVADPTLVATGVAWESQQQVYIVGRSHRGAYALWLVSCDSAIAADDSALVTEIAPVDIVAAARGPFVTDSGQAVLLQPNDPRGPYKLSKPLVPDGTKNPFFVN
jgi:lipoprotein LpqB-like beta-propeller protein